MTFLIALNNHIDNKQPYQKLFLTELDYKG